MVIVVNYLTIFSVVQRVYNGRTRPDVEAINKYECCRDTIDHSYLFPLTGLRPRGPAPVPY